MLVWGITGVIGKYSSQASEELAAGRMIIASLVFAPVILYGYFKQKVHSPATTTAPKGSQNIWIKLVLPSFVGVLISLHWYTFFEAIKVSNVSTALACMATAAIFATFIEALFYRRRPKKASLIASMMSLIGILFIYSDTLALGTQYNKGLALALVSAFLAATFTVLNSYLINAQQSSSRVTFVEMTAGALFSLWFYETGVSSIFDYQQTENFVALLTLGLVCTAPPFFLSIKLMRSLSPSTVCISINLEPVYAIVIALIVFKGSESMGSNFYVGALTVLISAVYSGLMEIRPSKKLQPVQ